MPTIPAESAAEGGDTDLLLAHEVEELTRLSGSTIRRLEQRGIFPKRLKIGPKRVAWLGREVRSYVSARAAERNAPTGAA